MNADLYYDLGNNYFFGDGVQENLGEAFTWFRAAAHGGHVAAQYNLAMMYRFGHGANMDKAAALHWYEEAARRGYRLAQMALGDMYYDAMHYEKAYFWYEQAANDGCAPAFYRLGTMFENGQFVYKSDAIAKMYYNMAEEQGYTPASFTERTDRHL
jgi:TPR repeat protein